MDSMGVMLYYTPLSLRGFCQMINNVLCNGLVTEINGLVQGRHGTIAPEMLWYVFLTSPLTR